MSNYECNEDRFLEGVKDHELTVYQDDDETGIRHMRLGIPGSSVLHYNLTTWPGYLCITGDMGSLVFSRINDMFSFFRNENRDSLFINPQYWAEKIQNEDARDGCKEYDSDLMCNVVMQILNDYKSSYEDEDHDNDMADLDMSIKENVIEMLGEGEFRDYHLVDNYQWESEDGSLEFYIQDLWDYNFKDYTYHYIWLCYAIVWGISKYDEYKSGLK